MLYIYDILIIKQLHMVTKRDLRGFYTRIPKELKKELFGVKQPEIEAELNYRFRSKEEFIEYVFRVFMTTDKSKLPNPHNIITI